MTSVLIIPVTSTNASWLRIRERLSRAKDEHQPPELLAPGLPQSLTKPLNHPTHITHEIPLPNNLAHPTLAITPINQTNEFHPAITPLYLETLEVNEEAQSLPALGS